MYQRKPTQPQEKQTPRSPTFEEARNAARRAAAKDSALRDAAVLGAAVVAIVAVLLMMIPRSFAPNWVAIDSYPSSTFRLEPAKSVAEEYYNAFGSPWTAKSPPNSAIPMGLTAGCRGVGPKEHEHAIAQDELNFLLNASVPLIYDECAHIDRAKEKTKIFTAALRRARVERNRDVKVFGYFLIPMGTGGEALYEAAKNNEEYFLHKRGLPKTAENRVMSRNKTPSGIFVFDIGNPEFQEFVAEFTHRHLSEVGLDGFVADWVNHEPIHYREEHELVDPDRIANWGKYWGELLTKVRQRIGSDKVIIANTYNVEQAFLLNIASPIDAIMIEDLIGAKSVTWKALRGNEPSRQTLWETATDIMSKEGRKTVLVTNANANCKETHSPNCFSERGIAEHQADARYYLAAYLNIMRETDTVMFYFNPTPTYPQFGSEAYFPEWDLPIGRSIAASREISESIYAREFADGLAVWSNSDIEFNLVLDAPMVNVDSVRVRSVRVPPKAGIILLSERVFPAGNPSFESASGWRPVAEPWGALEMDRRRVNSGSRSIRIDGNSGERGLRIPFNFEAKKTYTWSGTMMLEGTQSGRVVVASGVGPDGPWFREEAFKLGEGVWSRLDVTFVAPAAGFGWIYAAPVEFRAGRIWMDDVTITESE